MSDPYLRKISAQEHDIIYEDNGAVERRRIFEIDKVFTLIAYKHHVSEFTKRRLSYEEDPLQAVSSILDRFTPEGHAIYHLYGLPYVPKQVDYIEDGRDHHLDFKYSLLWTHGPLATPTRRRSTFPSWSWTGWEGQVNWLCGTTDLRKYVPADDSDTQFQVECPTPGNRDTFRAVEAWRPSRHDKHHPRRLLFRTTTTIFPLRIQEETGDSTNKSLFLDTSDRFKSRVYVTQQSLLSTETGKMKMQVIWLGTNYPMNSKYILFVQLNVSDDDQFKKHCYERVGVMIVSMDRPGRRNKAVIQGCFV